jgi:hypothetical protein
VVGTTRSAEKGESVLVPAGVEAHCGVACLIPYLQLLSLSTNSRTPALILTSTLAPSPTPTPTHTPGIIPLVADITDPAAIFGAASECDALVHCAWQGGADAAATVQSLSLTLL